MNEVAEGKCFEEIECGAHYEVIGGNGFDGEVQVWEDYEGESHEVTMLVKDLEDPKVYRSVR